MNVRCGGAVRKAPPQQPGKPCSGMRLPLVLDPQNHPPRWRQRIPNANATDKGSSVLGRHTCETDAEGFVPSTFVCVLGSGLKRLPFGRILSMTVWVFIRAAGVQEPYGSVIGAIVSLRCLHLHPSPLFTCVVPLLPCVVPLVPCSLSPE